MRILESIYHCKKCGVTEHPRGAIFYCFHGNSMGYNGKNIAPLGCSVTPHILQCRVTLYHGSHIVANFSKPISGTGNHTPDLSLITPH